MSGTLNIIQSSSDNLDSLDVRINSEFTKEFVHAICDAKQPISKPG